jgi:hypothetical protein
MPKFYWKTTGAKTAGTVVHIPVVVYLMLMLVVVCLMMAFGIRE